MEPQTGRYPSAILENDALILTYLTEAGPRITGLRVKGSATELLGAAPGLRVPTPFGEFSGIGGHRLWHSPEIFPRTYTPDSTGVIVQADDRRVRLTGPADPYSGIEKALEVELAARGPSVVLKHRLTNQLAWPVELAPWAITLLPMGGVALLPDRKAGSGLLPDRHWSFWPYTDLKDDRLDLEDGLTLVKASPKETALKVGYLNKSGWVGYFREGTLLVKHFDPQPGEPYPDFGCNAECYVKDEFIEVETIGKFTRLEPGASITHTETWRIHTGLEVKPVRAALVEMLRGLDLAS